jgi:predicted transposase YdaD
MEILMESTFYKEILAEGEAGGEARGEARGARRVLALQLRELLGGGAGAFTSRLDAADDEQVAGAARAFARIRDVEALTAALEALLPPATESR